MERLFCAETENHPLIDFNPNGNLELSGKLIPEDAVKVFQPMIDFADQLIAEKVVFNINLIYFNTASSKKIMELLRHLEANNSIQDIKVVWHFEEGDEDSVETAEIYEESLFRVDFRYHEYAEAA